ncbi:MAG TPA: thymidine phosphorylase [Planctomycetes bacterium]|nr:thymidine phosphorylase [Planctomycetota bacterium]HIL36766.1 thymidine phosphorylase [Planctomycetota bacterium]
MIDAAALVRIKRDGGTLNPDQVCAFVLGCTDGSIGEGPAAAMLMAILFNGLDDQELAVWTEAMIDSGDRLDLLDGVPLVDKHSTGGVGDKLSLVLAPSLAAAGARVPMISGRALGHTGGTLCKLESIPGFQVEHAPEDLGALLEVAGFFIIAQGPTLVPGDRLFYGLRNATATVESVPLIASSILSKKHAEGLAALVLDIKVGSGSSFVEEEQSLALAKRLVGLGHQLGIRTVGIRSAMDQPLGQMVGNALEVQESIDCLEGHGPADLRQLTVVLGGALLAASGLESDEAAGEDKISSVLESGQARDVFGRGISAQGGRLEELTLDAQIEDWPCHGSGKLGIRDCREISYASAALGGLRDGNGTPPDPIVGIEWLARAGDEVTAGQVLARIHHRNSRGLKEARARLSQAIDLENPVMPLPLVMGRLDP